LGLGRCLEGSIESAIGVIPVLVETTGSTSVQLTHDPLVCVEQWRTAGSWFSGAFIPARDLPVVALARLTFSPTGLRKRTIVEERDLFRVARRMMDTHNRNLPMRRMRGMSYWRFDGLRITTPLSGTTRGPPWADWNLVLIVRQGLFTRTAGRGGWDCIPSGEVEVVCIRDFLYDLVKSIVA
jgi:hypothetical protein